MIRHSVGTTMFRNAYYEVNGKKEDILRDGDLSCAIYVSSVLSLLKLIPEVHATVQGTVKDMRKAGWRRITKPREGCVIVWGTKTSHMRGDAHGHIGFFIGNGKAISNSSKKRSPAMHHWTFGEEGRPAHRKIEAMYWHKKLSS
jgi:hypothetical protein